RPCVLHDALPISTQGDYIALSMGEVAPVSAGFRPWIRLVSPTGVLLATSSAGASAVQVATNAPTTGTYTVIGGTNDVVGRNEDSGRYRSEEQTARLQT